MALSLAVSFGAFGAGSYDYGTNSYPAAQASEESVSDSAESASQAWGRGEYIIGEDLPAGEYLIYTEDTSENNTYSPATFTLYHRGSEGKKIGTFRFQHHGLITLYNGQRLILSRGWAVPADTASLELIPAGMYLAGRDIEPGTYRLSALTADGAHYALYNDVRYYYNYMDDYVTFFEPVTVTVEEGQYLELIDVGSIEKTG